MKKSRFSSRALMVPQVALSAALGLLAIPSLPAADRVWSAGTGATDFNSGSNYTPTGTIDGTADLIFNTATNPNLALSAGLAIDSLLIEAGASGFVLGSANTLTMNNGGITIADSTSATFNSHIASNGNATQLTFTVGSGSTMTVNGLVLPYARPFYKKGAGTLYLAAGTGTTANNSLRSGTSINIEEGTLEIGNAAQFEPGSTLASLAVHIGTATTTATLKGGGSFVGIAGKPVTLTTYGSAHSIIEPAGDGTLAIQNLNASSGATFRFDLGSDLIFGTGTLTGSLLAGGLALDLSGGAAGVTYTLFDYGTLSGVDASDFAIGTEGYTVEFWNINNGLVQVQFSAVPEPGNYAAFGLLLLVAFLIKKERQKALNS